MCFGTESYRNEAYTIAQNLGLARDQLVILPEDFEWWKEDQARAYAKGVVEEVVRGFTRKNQQVKKAKGEGWNTGTLAAAVVKKLEDPEAVQELFLEKQWTDGLPIVAPTEDRVQAMMATAKRMPQDIVTFLAPQWGAATIEKLAVNAVMAGCRPEYFPVVVAAVEAMAEPDFDLQLHSTCTSSTTPLIIVNGPVRKQINMNSGHSVFGSIAPANAAIGRALRLIRLNIGGQIPGLIDKSTFGFPGGYSLCIAEDEESNPWEPLHVQRGFKAGDSTVTIAGVMSFQDVHTHRAREAESLLTIIAHSVAWMGCTAFHVNPRDIGYVLIILPPDIAQRLAEEGYSLRDVQLFLRDNSRMPLADMPQEVVPHLERLGRIDGDHVYIGGRPEQFVVFVAGGFNGGGSGELATIMHANPQDWKIITKTIELS